MVSECMCLPHKTIAALLPHACNTAACELARYMQKPWQWLAIRNRVHSWHCWLLEGNPLKDGTLIRPKPRSTHLCSRQAHAQQKGRIPGIQRSRRPQREQTGLAAPSPLRCPVLKAPLDHPGRLSWWPPVSPGSRRSPGPEH